VSQLIGQNFKTRIPEFSDDASIEEALKVYHYGVDNYSVGPIPNDSIEGNFRTLDTQLVFLQNSLTSLESRIVKIVSQSSNPNIITSQTVSTVPLTIRAIASQTSSLQQWQNFSNNVLASISTSGYFATVGYASIGSITQASTIALSVNIVGPSNKGVVIKSTISQTANLQEWQDSSGTPLAGITPSGDFFANRIDGGSP
jgi:hypothetical protein